MTRQTKNCSRCGEFVEIVPAGVSKKPPYAPYGSFAKCKACGNSEQIGQQPPKSPQNAPYQQNRQPQGWNPPNAPQGQIGGKEGFLAQEMTKLANRISKLEEHLYGKTMELPVHDLPPLEQENIDPMGDIPF